MPRSGKSTKATFPVSLQSPVAFNSHLGLRKPIIAVCPIFEPKTHKRIVGFKVRPISPIRQNPWRGYWKRVRMAITRSRKATAIQKTPLRPKSRPATRKKSRKGQKDNSPQDNTSNNRDRAEHPEDYPDLDFHHTFGSFLTRKNPITNEVSAEIARYWGLLSNTPSLLQHHAHEIGEKYRGAFRKFFTADPISLHGHVSDASNAALLTSLISTSSLALPKTTSRKATSRKATSRKATSQMTTSRMATSQKTSSRKATSRMATNRKATKTYSSARKIKAILASQSSKALTVLDTGVSHTMQL